MQVEKAKDTSTLLQHISFHDSDCFSWRCLAKTIIEAILTFKR